MAKDRSPDRVNVYEVMAKPFISVDADMDIRYCARLFDQFNITRAPVLHEGDVVGIVSFTDLVLRGMVDAEAAGHAEGRPANWQKCHSRELSVVSPKNHVSQSRDSQ